MLRCVFWMAIVSVGLAAATSWAGEQALAVRDESAPFLLCPAAGQYSSHPMVEAGSQGAPSTPLLPESLSVPEDARQAPDPIGDGQPPAATSSPAVQAAVNEAHAACFADDHFPSARVCRNCHPDQYREWSVSPHAYAQLSPVFNAMSSKLIELNNGTLGDFCIRCHTPVGMALCEPIVMANADRHPASREGVTCVVCHRINQAWGKGAGRQALVPGDINTPVSGPTGSANLAAALADPERYGVLEPTDDPEIRGRRVHRTIVPFFQMTTSAFCGACHDVFAPNGFRLEDAFSEFKSAPASRLKHQSCQDCHMGIVPGVAAGYACGPAAMVGNAPTPPRKRANHMIVGPDYSIVHPGIFPHNPAAVREEHDRFRDPTETGLATIREWLLFDDQAGWGTEAFEHEVDDKYVFPEDWQDAARRFRARDILNEQYRLLGEATSRRYQLLATGYHLGKVIVDKSNGRKISFRVCVCNGTDGHGVPTGFDAERIVFLRTMIFDGDGKRVFISGDLDPNGDLRDSHSAYVHNSLLPFDEQLFSLQSLFITRNIRGGEREQVLNVPYSLDPLPYVRPETRPFTVLGRPVGARKQKQIIVPNGHRWASYEVPICRLSGPAPHTLVVQLIAGMVPINLVREIASVGFDYDLSARQVAARIVAGHQLLHERRVVLETCRGEQ